METTKHKLPENTNRFFINLSNYLDTQILFFGSVQRQDYFPGHSDIDIVIFTDNEKSLLTKLQHFLKVDRAKIKKTVMRLYHNNHVVHGYKLMYKNPELVAPIEMSIYNEK